MRWLTVAAVVGALLAAACGGEAAETGGRPADTAAVGATPTAGQTTVRPTRTAARRTQTPRPTRVAGVAGCRAPGGAGDFVFTVETEAGERSYRLHVPKRVQPGRAAPLVVNFHGFGKDAEQHEAYSGMVPVADKNGFLLATPDGSGWGYPLGWNVVGIYGEDGVDDVAFTQLLVEDVERRYCVDAKRVFAAGMSNGAEMAAQVGCYLPDVFAAVAPVSGVVYQGCEGRPMPVISFHGTWDENVPFEFARPAMYDWAMHNGCSEEVVTRQVTGLVSVEQYVGCGGADVVLYVIEEAAHQWPGTQNESGGAGPANTEISASELIWGFFSTHSMP